MNQVIVRYGPSPTGIPHIGNIRTALFNFLFAKNQGGKFLLRIEDTDQARIAKGAVEKIKESLTLLGLNWDGEIIFQSKRLNLYKKYLDELKLKNLAYEDGGAWRFKIQTNASSVNWQDAVHGSVTFPTNVLEDFVIIKSDGFPTYHFASIVDDHEMKITHVLRGDEWISSTPKHILLYKALGWQHPNFVHLPPILGSDHKKLSKRDGAKSIIEYTDEGYLTEALINFMVLLGWSPKGNQEFFSLQELIKEFSLERINKNSPVFNTEKLDWFNGQWIRKITDKQLANQIHKLDKKYTEEKILEFLPLVKDRLQKLDDFSKLAGPLLEDKITANPSQVVLGPDKLKIFVKEYLNVGNWTKANISQATVRVMDAENLSKSDALGSIGTSISGSTVTPPIYDTLEKLGKERTIERLEDVINKKQK